MNYYGLLDERLQETVWETKVPLKMELSYKDLTTAKTPLTLYYSLPRISYIASIFLDIFENFKDFASAELSSLWIEHEGRPIRWQYPLGVIIDSLGINFSKGPIVLTVRFRNMPKEVIPCESNDSLRFYFMNSIKEADVIRFPTEQKFFKLKKESTLRIKDIVYENNPKNITEYRKIMSFEVKISKYPVKLIFRETDYFLTKSIEIQPGKENDYTIEDCLNESLKPEVYSKLKEGCRILIHGLDIEEKMSFLFYYFNFAYLDTFLYITFTLKKKEN